MESSPDSPHLNKRYWEQEQIEAESDASHRYEKNKFKEKRERFQYSDDDYDVQDKYKDRMRPRSFRSDFKSYREDRYQRDYNRRNRYDRNLSPVRYRDERERYFSDDDRINENRFQEKYEERQRRNEKRTADRDRYKRPHSPNKNKENYDVNRSDQKDEADMERTSKKTKTTDDIFTKAGGAYIPPAKLRMMQAEITDKSSVSYQKIAWEALKKSINGYINKVNVSNLKIIILELLKENLVRGRGVLVRSMMQAQAVSPTFTHVYAAVAAIINTKFPQICELLLRRLIIQFRKGYRRNDKLSCVSSTRFIAHLVNQKVAHEVLALEILTLLLENPTEDSIEMCVGFLKECGERLTEVSKAAVNAIFDRLRSILHDAKVDKRVQYMIEVMFAIRKDKFKDHPAIIDELDVVEEDDQFTHLITLEDAVDSEDILNVFKFDPEYEANEEKYQEIKKEILSGESDTSGEENSDEETEEENENDENENENQTIIDNTETNLISLRRTIYLVIQSSLDFEECAHKLLKLELQPGQIVELCYMILDCCAQQRTYEKFFGLLAQRFCQLNKIYVEPFEDIFKTAYDTIHRFETNKLRNVARFFAHLLYTDAISWMVLSHIKLNEEDTTSSSRIFIKILFQELCEYMGLLKLNERVKDPTMQEAFDGLFPRDTSRNTRFAINFFTSIGLGGLTDELREHLKSIPKPTQLIPQPPKPSSSDEENSSSEDNHSISENSSNEDESSEEEPRKKSKRKSSKLKSKKKKSKHHKKSKKKHKE